MQTYITNELYFGKTLTGVSDMSRVTIRKSGNANIISLPKVLLEQMGAKAGDNLQVTFEDGKIILERPRKELPTLEWLLEGITPETYNTEEDNEWMNMRPRGEELL